MNDSTYLHIYNNLVIFKLNSAQRVTLVTKFYDDNSKLTGSKTYNIDGKVGINVHKLSSTNNNMTVELLKNSNGNVISPTITFPVKSSNGYNSLDKCELTYCKNKFIFYNSHNETHKSIIVRLCFNSSNNYSGLVTSNISGEKGYSYVTSSKKLSTNDIVFVIDNSTGMRITPFYSYDDICTESINVKNSNTNSVITNGNYTLSYNYKNNTATVNFKNVVNSSVLYLHHKRYDSNDNLYDLKTKQINIKSGKSPVSIVLSKSAKEDDMLVLYDSEEKDILAMLPINTSYKYSTSTSNNITNFGYGTVISSIRQYGYLTMNKSEKNKSSVYLTKGKTYYFSRIYEKNDNIWGLYGNYYYLLKNSDDKVYIELEDNVDVDDYIDYYEGSGYGRVVSNSNLFPYRDMINENSYKVDSNSLKYNESYKFKIYEKDNIVWGYLDGLFYKMSDGKGTYIYNSKYTSGDANDIIYLGTGSGSRAISEKIYAYESPTNKDIYKTSYILDEDDVDFKIYESNNIIWGYNNSYYYMIENKDNVFIDINNYKVSNKATLLGSKLSGDVVVNSVIGREFMSLHSSSYPKNMVKGDTKEFSKVYSFNNQIWGLYKGYYYEIQDENNTVYINIERITNLQESSVNSSDGIQCKVLQSRCPYTSYDNGKKVTTDNDDTTLRLYKGDTFTTNQYVTKDNKTWCLYNNYWYIMKNGDKIYIDSTIFDNNSLELMNDDNSNKRTGLVKKDYLFGYEKPSYDSSKDTTHTLNNNTKITCELYRDKDSNLWAYYNGIYYPTTNKDNSETYIDFNIKHSDSKVYNITKRYCMLDGTPIYTNSIRSTEKISKITDVDSNTTLEPDMNTDRIIKGYISANSEYYNEESEDSSKAQELYLSSADTGVCEVKNGIYNQDYILKYTTTQIYKNVGRESGEASYDFSCEYDNDQQCLIFYNYSAIQSPVSIVVKHYTAKLKENGETVLSNKYVIDENNYNKLSYELQSNKDKLVVTDSNGDVVYSKYFLNFNSENANNTLYKSKLSCKVFNLNAKYYNGNLYITSNSDFINLEISYMPSIGWENGKTEYGNTVTYNKKFNVNSLNTSGELIVDISSNNIGNDDLIIIKDLDNNKIWVKSRISEIVDMDKLVGNYYPYDWISARIEGADVYINSKKNCNVYITILRGTSYKESTNKTEGESEIDKVTYDWNDPLIYDNYGNGFQVTAGANNMYRDISTDIIENYPKSVVSIYEMVSNELLMRDTVENLNMNPIYGADVYDKNNFLFFKFNENKGYYDQHILSIINSNTSDYDHVELYVKYGNGKISKYAYYLHFNYENEDGTLAHNYSTQDDYAKQDGDRIVIHLYSHSSSDENYNRASYKDLVVPLYIIDEYKEIYGTDDIDLKNISILAYSSGTNGDLAKAVEYENGFIKAGGLLYKSSLDHIKTDVNGYGNLQNYILSKDEAGNEYKSDTNWLTIKYSLDEFTISSNVDADLYIQRYKFAQSYIVDENSTYPRSCNNETPQAGQKFKIIHNISDDSGAGGYITGMRAYTPNKNDSFNEDVDDTNYNNLNGTITLKADGSTRKIKIWDNDDLDFIMVFDSATIGQSARYDNKCHPLLLAIKIWDMNSSPCITDTVQKEYWIDIQYDKDTYPPDVEKTESELSEGRSHWIKITSLQYCCIMLMRQLSNTIKIGEGEKDIISDESNKIYSYNFGQRKEFNNEEGIGFINLLNGYRSDVNGYDKDTCDNDPNDTECDYYTIDPAYDSELFIRLDPEDDPLHRPFNLRDIMYIKSVKEDGDLVDNLLKRKAIYKSLEKIPSFENTKINENDEISVEYNPTLGKYGSLVFYNFVDDFYVDVYIKIHGTTKYQYYPQFHLLTEDCYTMELDQAIDDKDIIKCFNPDNGDLIFVSKTNEVENEKAGVVKTLEETQEDFKALDEEWEDEWKKDNIELYKLKHLTDGEDSGDSEDIEGDEISVTGFNLPDGIISNFTIPDKIDNFTVKGIYGFDEYFQLEEIYLPDGLVTIGAYAFYNNTKLKKVHIPSSVTEIGNYAFYNNTSLEEVNLPTKLETLAEGAFYGCSALKSITIPDAKLDTIEDYVFSGCKSLTKVKIPRSITSIGTGSFQACLKLQELIFADGSKLTSIGDSCFAACESLVQVQLPQSVEELGKSAFSGCINLIGFGMTNTLNKIGDSCFADDTALIAMSFPNKLTECGTDILKNCTGLINLNFYTTHLGVESLQNICEDCQALDNCYVKFQDENITYDKYITLEEQLAMIEEYKKSLEEQQNPSDGSATQLNINGSLFCGDSIVVSMESSAKAKGAKVFGCVSANANFYLGEVTAPSSETTSSLKSIKKGSKFDWDSTFGKVSNPSCIVILLGHNACGGGTGYADSVGVNGIQQLVNKFKSSFANSKIAICSPIPCGSSYNEASKYKADWEYLTPKLQQLADNQTVFYVDITNGYASDGVANSNYVSSDGLHPTTKGAKLLVDNLASGLSAITIQTGDNNGQQANRAGVATGGSFNSKAYQLSDDQIQELATLAYGEAGDSNTDLLNATISHIPNIVEYWWNTGLFTNTKGDLFAGYRANKKWWASSSFTRGSSQKCIDAVKSIICNGQRTIPPYVVEFDGFAEMSQKFSGMKDYLTIDGKNAPGDPAKAKAICEAAVTGQSQVKGSYGGSGTYYKAFINGNDGNVFYYNESYKQKLGL